MVHTMITPCSIEHAAVLLRDYAEKNNRCLLIRAVLKLAMSARFARQSTVADCIFVHVIPLSFRVRLAELHKMNVNVMLGLQTPEQQELILESEKMVTDGIGHKK